MNLDELFNDYLIASAKQSKDPNTKVGAIIVKDDRLISSGWNGFARGVKDLPERWEIKHDFGVVHAEANAICNAAKEGISTNGATMWVNRFPCLACADLIIQSGIKGIVVTSEEESLSSRCDISRIKFEEAGIEYELR